MGDIARVKVKTQIPRWPGLLRESLYKPLSVYLSRTFVAIVKVISGLRFILRAYVKAGAISEGVAEGA